MQVSKTIVLVFVIFAFGCNKITKEDVIYDNIIYEMDDVTLYTSSAEKTKQKTQAQYISIMYADLFNRSITNQELNELEELSIAMGDKTKANELILSHYFQQSDVSMPTDSEMRTDINQFIEETYIKFYQRLPTAYENHRLKAIIVKDIALSPEAIYTSFILSNEYYFY